MEGEASLIMSLKTTAQTHDWYFQKCGEHSPECPSPRVSLKSCRHSAVRGLSRVRAPGQAGLVESWGPLGNSTLPTKNGIFGPSQEQTLACFSNCDISLAS